MVLLVAQKDTGMWLQNACPAAALGWVDLPSQEQTSGLLRSYSCPDHTQHRFQIVQVLDIRCVGHPVLPVTLEESHLGPAQLMIRFVFQRAVALWGQRVSGSHIQGPVGTGYPFLSESRGSKTGAEA